MDKSSLMKMTKIVSSKVELAKTIIEMYTCFNNIKLSDTEITVLAYFMVYGINSSTKNLIVKSAVCKGIPSVKTIMVKLKKLGLIYKDDLNGKVYISKNIDLELTPSVALLVKIDNGL